MSHTPFDTWLFSNEPLTNSQQNELDDHLDDCQSCQEISQALGQIRVTFTNSPTPAPLPGFTQRWHNRLSTYRQTRQHRNMWLLTLGLFGLAGLIISVMVVVNFNTIHWMYEFSQLVATISLCAYRISQFWNAVKSFTNAFPILVPILVTTGFGALSVIGAFIVAWFSSIINLYKPVQKGENAG